MRIHLINDGGNTLIVNDKTLSKMLTNITEETTHCNIINMQIITLELDEEEEGKRLDFVLNSFRPRKYEEGDIID